MYKRVYIYEKIHKCANTCLCVYLPAAWIEDQWSKCGRIREGRSICKLALCGVKGALIHLHSDNMCTQTWMGTCVHVGIQLRRSGCMVVTCQCVYVCKRINLYAFIHIYIYVHVHTYKYKYTYFEAYMYIFEYMHT